jgi:hypothetical protein
MRENVQSPPRFSVKYIYNAVISSSDDSSPLLPEAGLLWFSDQRRASSICVKPLAVVEFVQVKPVLTVINDK